MAVWTWKQNQTAAFILDNKMRWEIKTEKKVHVISALSSADAVNKVRKTDETEIKGARILPQNTTDKIKSVWYRLIK